MDGNPLRRISVEEALRPPMRRTDPEIERAVSRIIGDVGARGEAAVREWAERLGECAPGERLLLDRRELESAWNSLDPRVRSALESAHGRIRAFSEAQKACLSPLDMRVPGGRAGHRLLPVAAAGCYAPGGRHPLPSSALMTVTPAKVAGVREIWCAGPRPAPATLGAAFLAGADGFLRVGGAQAIAAMAFGVLIPACSVVAGPGGSFVAAAKRQLYGIVGTEAPAGPSELLVIAGESADPDIVAADLLAVAEHDTAAFPLLLCLSEKMLPRVEGAIAEALGRLPEPNSSTASQSLAAGWACVVEDPATACRIAQAWAPEHLSLSVRDPAFFEERIDSAGTVFRGELSGEVFGDYGAGPNHTLPTSGAAKFKGGLSVFDFLRVRTWLELDEPDKLAADTAFLARMEGLEAHARAVEASGLASLGRAGSSA